MILCIFLGLAIAYGKSGLNSGLQSEFDSSNVPRVLDTVKISGNCSILSIGWGNPQGTRFEIGEYLSSNIIVGGTISINDQWSNDRSSTRFGAILGLLFTSSESTIRPFILGSVGETFVLIGKSEYFLFCHFGFNVPSNSFLQIRPEAGIDLTFKNDVSGSLKRQTWFGFNISMLVSL